MDIGGFSGEVLPCQSTSDNSCKAYVMDVSGSGFSGVYGTGSSLGEGSRRRRLAESPSPLDGYGDELADFNTPFMRYPDREDGKNDTRGRRLLSPHRGLDTNVDHYLSDPLVCIQVRYYMHATRIIRLLDSRYQCHGTARI